MDQPRSPEPFDRPDRDDPADGEAAHPPSPVEPADDAQNGETAGDAPPDRDAPEAGDARGQRIPAWLDTAVQYTWRGLVLIAGLAAVLWLMTRLYLVTLPVIVALILATLFVPPARRLERRGWPRIAAAAVVVIGGIGTLAGIIALLTPAFLRQTRELQPTVLAAADQVLTWLEESPIGYDRAQLERLFEDALATVEGSAGTIATSIGSIAMAVAEAVSAMALAVVLLFFFVKDGTQIVQWCIERTPPQHRDTVRAAGTRGWVALSGFVRGTALVALIDAVGIGIGLAILGVPLVLPLSVLIFLGGFVPVIGAFTTAMLAVLVALADGGVTTALIVLAIVLAVQQIEGNVLQPTIMRRAVALHPVIILGVLTAGAVLIGVVGAFLAVPVAAVLAAVGNELRIRNEYHRLGIEAGPKPVAGPGVDPSLALPEFPVDTDIRARRRPAGMSVRRASRGAAGGTEPQPNRSRRRQRRVMESDVNQARTDGSGQR